MQDLSEETIADLLNQIAGGSDKAATMLYSHYHDFVFAFLRHTTGDQVAAEEASQEVFIDILRKPYSFNGASKFSTWLCSIAKNKGVDWMRKNRRMASLGEDYSEVSEQLVDPNADFVAKIEIGQDSEALRYCRDKLSEMHREVIFWVYFEDEGLETVAQKLNCPQGTVKSRLFHARKSLQQCLTRWIAGGRYGK